MANVTGDDYKNLFEDLVVIRPYLYVDATPVDWSKNVDGSISIASCSEIMKMLKTKTAKKSYDIHGHSSAMLDRTSENYWHLSVRLSNH